MIPKAVVLLLVAATAVSGRIAHGQKSHPGKMVLMPVLSRGCPTALEPAPLICKFLQPDLEFHYKPQLIAPTTYIPPMVVEKCDHPEMDIEIPAPIMKDIVIPEAPVLPPITIPKFPIPVILEKPFLPPAPIVEPCEPAFVSEMPGSVLPEIIAQPESTFDEIAVPEVPFQPLVVPHLPVFPEFVMPDLPVNVEVPMAEPCLDDQLIPVAPIPEFIPPAPMPFPVAEHVFVQKAVVPSIPAAPELPPFEMPALPEIELPEPVAPEIPHQPLVVPQSPEITAVEMPKLPVMVELPIAEPCLEDQPLPAPMPEFIPIVPAFMPEIPMAPVFPPFEMPALPEIETKVEPPVPSYQPIAVPQAPELPAFVMPELPVRVEAPMPEPCLEDELIAIAPTPEYISLPVPMPGAESFKPAFVAPEIPIMPPFKIPTFPAPAVTSYIPTPHIPELPVPMMPPMIAPCPEDQLPVVSFPEYIHPLPPMPMFVPMNKPDPADPCEPSSKPVKMADLLYFVRQPSYLPAVHGDYYNHLPRMGAHMRYV